MNFTPAILLAAIAAVPTRAADCDRECLRGFITQYLNAMVAHNPAALPVSGNVRFTQDAVTMKLGGLGTYRQDILDVRQASQLLL